MKESLLCRVLVFLAETPKSAVRIEKRILSLNNNSSQQSFEDDNTANRRDRFHDVLAVGRKCSWVVGRPETHCSHRMRSSTPDLQPT